MYFSVFVVLLCVFAPVSLWAQSVVIKDYPVDKVSPNVYVLHGPTAVPNADNQGFMNNPGFVITSKGVVVIDPGSVVEAGEMTLRAIKSITAKPVVAIFNTHIHADHWFGNEAIARVYPDIPIYAHQATLDEAQTVGEAWVHTVKSLTKINQLEGNVQTANQAVNNGDIIQIGETTFTIYHDTISHTNSDIMIAVNGDEAIFLGDNLFNGRLNAHTEGHIKKTWESVEKAVETSKAKIIVPGHGQTGDKNMMNFALKAHKLLYQSVKSQYEDDVSDFEMRPTVESLLSDYKQWDEFDNLLGKVINKAFLEIEEADF